MSDKKIKILTITVEISDQYGTSKDVLVGFFDDDDKLKLAIEDQKNKYRTVRTKINVKDVELNISRN